MTFGRLDRLPAKHVVELPHQIMIRNNLHVLACVTVETKMYLLHMYERRSSQLYTPLLQLRKERLKKIQACSGFELLTSVTSVQRSTNWANKPTWKQVVELVCYKPMKVMNIWKSSMRTAGWRIIWKFTSALNFISVSVLGPPRWLVRIAMFWLSSLVWLRNCGEHAQNTWRESWR